VQRFRGGLVFKAHRLLYHSTLGLRVIKQKGKEHDPATHTSVESHPHKFLETDLFSQIGRSDKRVPHNNPLFGHPCFDNTVKCLYNTSTCFENTYISVFAMPAGVFKQNVALDYTPSTLNPQPSTLNPQPSTLNPQPSTPNPKPQTPTPKLQTPNPNPKP